MLLWKLKDYENLKLVNLPTDLFRLHSCLSQTWWLTLQWRHNERGGVSNNWHFDCLLNRLSKQRSKKTQKLRVTGLCEENSPHKGPITRKMFPFDDGIMKYRFGVGGSKVFCGSSWSQNRFPYDKSFAFTSNWYTARFFSRYYETYELTHWSRVTYICVGKLNHHWFR